MDQNSNTLFFDKCRLCLNLPGILNVFESNNLPLHIYWCVGVEISPSDNLPQKICEPCSKTIEKATSLRALALLNDSHLKSLFDDNTQIDESNDDQISSTSTSCYSNAKLDSVDAAQVQISVRKDLFNSSDVTMQHNLFKANEKPNTPDKNEEIVKDEIVYYDCKECKKTFTEFKKFYHHQRSHIKTIHCPIDVCGKKFSTKNDLIKHVRTHTGEKPYKCDLCEKKFAQKVTLKSHLTTMHAEKSSIT